MAALSKLLIADFIKSERLTLVRVEDELRYTPLTYEQRLAILEDILKRGIKYGIDKGIFIEEERVRKVQRAKRSFIEKYVNELVFSLNFRNALYKDQPKIKYSKRKYRLRKKHGGEQLKLKFSV